MKQKFTKKSITYKLKCCKEEEILALKCISNKPITLKNLLDELPIKKFIWFLTRECKLTIKQKQLLSIHCAKQSLNIYEEAYPDDKRLKECVKAIDAFMNKEITIEELVEKRRNIAYAASYAMADDNNSAADAVYSVDAAAAFICGDKALYGADSAAYAATFAINNEELCKKFIWEFIESITK